MLIEKASKEPDRYAAQAYEQAGKEAQKKWGCHIGGHKHLPVLSEGQKDALEAVGKLTGADCSECKTCPRSDLYFTDINGNRNELAYDIEKACKARTWRDKGQLQLINGSDPKNTLVEALDVLDEAFSRRELYDAKKREEKWEAEKKRMEEASRPNVRDRFEG